MLTAEPSLDDAGATGSLRPRDRRPIAVTIRRRRVLAVLLGTAALCAALGVIPALRGLWWLAAVSALMAGAYLALVARVRHLHAQRELALAFGRDVRTVHIDWSDMEHEVDLGGAAELDELRPAPAPLDNHALGRFLVSYALGWVLLPVVVVIRLLRGDLSDLERHGVLGRIVRLQQYGRSQSLRLLAVGAVATAGVSAMAAPAMAAPAMASTPNAVVASAPAARASASSAPAAISTSGVRYTVRAGDTLSALAQRHSTSVDALVAANHIADPNLILVGQVLMIPGSGTAAGATTVATPAGRSYTVQAGDSLWKIANDAGVTLDALTAANHLSIQSLILPGQVLVLPAPTSSTGASQPTAHRTPAAPAVATPVVAPAPHAAPVATPVVAPVRGASGYLNPFASGPWSPARTDEGVDWIPTAPAPVVAIGDGVVTYSSMSSGWPGGAFIAYRLSDGSHAGFSIYVAEHLTNLVPVGTKVRAGQVIATALPGYPWTEWGWAAASGPSPAPSALYNGVANGSSTAGGRSFARFLKELGAHPLEDPGPGPDTP